MDIKNSWLFTKPIAHRGLHTFEFPENSLAAFANAVKFSYAIELDVRLSDDGEVIVFHDEKLSRMTKTDGYVSKLKLSEIKELKLLNSDGCHTEETIPTLKEVFDTINGAVPILIEVKNDAKVGRLESKVVELLRNYSGEVALQSFNPYSLAYFQANAANLFRGQLSAWFKKEDLSGFFKRNLLKKLKMNKISKPDFVSYKYTDLPNKYVNSSGLPVLAWVIGSNAEMEKSLQFCDNIIFENFIPNIQKNDKVSNE